MRNAHQVRRSPRISRLEHGILSPLKLLQSSNTLFNFRPHPPGPPPERHEPSAAILSGLRFGSSMSINLRRFLIEELGPVLRFEDDAVVALHPESEAQVMRELARAIRRFSFQRAREQWIECLAAVPRLQAELIHAAFPAHRVVLCTRCAQIASGASAQADHREPDCMPVVLNAALSRDDLVAGAFALIRRAFCPVIEEFRLARTAAGLPHFDLDCYARGDFLVFTWRPLPALSH